MAPRDTNRTVPGGSMSYNEDQPSAPPPRTVSLLPTSPQPPDKPLPPMPPGHAKKESKFFTYFKKAPSGESDF